MSVVRPERPRASSYCMKDIAFLTSLKDGGLPSSWIISIFFFFTVLGISKLPFSLALRFSRSSCCLASLSLFQFSSEGRLRRSLKAIFLFSISSSRRSWDSVNQSGLF